VADFSPLTTLKRPLESTGKPYGGLAVGVSEREVSLPVAASAL
jgi:hypothetical protein